MIKMKRAGKILATCIFVTSSLIACDSDNGQSLNSDRFNTDSTGSQEITAQDTDEQQVGDFVDTADPLALEGSWLSNCFTLFPDEPTEYERQFVVVQGASYERTINYFQDSDCSIPTAISYIRIRSSEFEITNNTFQTALGTATIINVGSWSLDIDESTFSDEEVSLFDPAFGIYDIYLLSSDGQLFLDYRCLLYTSDAADE